MAYVIAHEMQHARQFEDVVGASDPVRAYENRLQYCIAYMGSAGMAAVSEDGIDELYVEQRMGEYGKVALERYGSLPFEADADKAAREHDPAYAGRIAQKARLTDRGSKEGETMLCT